MHTSGPREDPLIDMGYETRDVDYPKLRKAVISYFGFALFCGICGVIIYRYRFFILHIPQPKDDGVAMNRPLPPDEFPKLQSNMTSKTDIMDMRRQETVRLNATEYADDTHTVVHIPVNHAMELIAQRGLPPTGNAVPAVSKGNTTDQNSTPAAATSPSGTPAPGAPTSGTTEPATSVPGSATGGATTGAGTTDPISSGIPGRPESTPGAPPTGTPPTGAPAAGNTTSNATTPSTKPSSSKPGGH